MASITGYTKAALDAKLALLATLASPIFTGTPTLPTGTIAVTQTAGNNSTKIATTAYADAADALKAPLASPALTGTPTAPTPTAGDITTKLATTAFVAGSFATLASPALTGNPTAPTQTAGDNTTKLATTAFVQGLLASPAFTGAPTAPTASPGTNSTQIATTAFVQGGKIKTVNFQNGTTYTLVLSDAEKIIEASNASAQTITIPPNSAVAFPVGTCIQMTQIGTAKASFAAGAGVTLVTPGGTAFGCRVIWSTITLRKRATDIWVLSDDVG